MGSFGERMQREREMRGITLEEISESTKIGTRSLRALEEEDFAKLPGGIFNKGFVRAYARYLGIDEEQAVADFLAAVGQSEQAAPAPPEPPILVDAPEPERNWAPLVLLFVLVALVIAGWKLYPVIRQLAVSPVAYAPSKAAAKRGTPASASPKTSVMTAPATPAAASSRPSGTSQPAATPVPASVPEGFVVQIRARKNSWVSITADGKLYAEGMMSAQQERQVRARNQVVLKMGNAGGVEVTHNGKPLPPLGSEGQVATVTLTPDGLQR